MLHSSSIPRFVCFALIALLTISCSSTPTEQPQIPTLAVLPGEAAPTAATAAGQSLQSPSETATPETQIDPDIQAGIDALFTQTAQARAALAPTETVIAAFNELLTATAEGVSNATGTAQGLERATQAARQTANAVSRQETEAFATQQSFETATSVAQLRATEARYATQTARAQINATATAQASLASIDETNITRLELLNTFENVSVLEFSPYENIMATGGSNLTLWDLRTLQPILSHPIDRSLGQITDIKFNGRARQVAVAAGSSVLVYTIDMSRSALNLRHQLDDVEQLVTAIQFDPNNNRLISGNSGGEVLLWSLVDGSLLQTLDIGFGVIEWIGYSTVADIIIVKTDSALEAWNIRTGVRDDSTRLIGSSGFEAEYSHSGVRMVHTQFSYNRSSELVITRISRTINLTRTIEIPNNGHVTSVAIDSSETFVAAGLTDLGIQRGNDPGIRIWRIGSGEEVLALPLEQAASITQIQFSLDGKLMAVTAGNRAYLYGIRDRD